MTEIKLFEKFFTKDKNGHTIGTYGGWYILPNGRIVDCAEFFLWLSKNKEKYMTEQEIRERIRELEKPDIERRNELFNLRKAQMELQKEKLHSLIGHCYKTKQRIFMITDVPQPRYQMNGHFDFNPYQIPAMVIQIVKDTKSKTLETIGVGEIYYETIYSKAVDSANPIEAMQQQYEQISIEDFRTAAHTVINQVMDRYTPEKS